MTATTAKPRITMEDVRESTKGIISPRRWWQVIRSPRRTIQNAVGSGPVYPLLILFGLNCVDELDRTGFGILLPNVRDAFGLTNTGILTLVGFTAVGALLLQMPIAIAADRYNRVLITVAGALTWGVFSMMTGMATATWMLIVARTGSGIGKAVVDPTHNSLLSDYYAVDRRSSVFSFHRAANVVGQFLGPLLAGILAAAFSWRTPFFVFTVPTVILALLALRMKEPVRGAQERRAAGVSEDVVETEEPQASFSESWRLLWKIEVLRRIWYAVPFLAISLIGFVSLASLVYEEVFGLDELQRGYLAASIEPFQLIGLAVGAKLGTRLFLRSPALIFRFLRTVALLAAAFVAFFALVPVLWVAIVANILLTSTLAILLPGILAILSLAIPARARAVGFSVASWWAIPGLALLPLIGWIADNANIQIGMLVMAPILAVGGLIIASGGTVVQRDIEDVWTGSAARSQALFDRKQGRAKLLSVKDLQVSYGPLQVLFDVNLEIAEGEIVALLGTNGAGKSTLLKAISGITEANYGAVLFDGRDITHAPPNEIAAIGMTQMPGGNGVFPSLSVAREPAGGRVVAAVRSRRTGTADRRGARGVPGPRQPGGRDGGQPLRWPAADAGPGHVAPGPAPPADHRRAEPRTGTGDRVATGGDRPRRRPFRYDDPAGRTVGQRRAHHGLHRLLHGARPNPVRRARRGTAGQARPPPCRVPRGGRIRRRSTVTGPARRPEAGRVDIAVAEPAAARNGEPPPTAPLELMNVTRRFGGISAVEDVTLRVADREIVGPDRPERRRQDDDLRPDLRVPAARRRTDPPRRRRRLVVEPDGAGTIRSRPDLPGWTAVPRPHRVRLDRGVARSLPRRPGSLQRGLPAPRPHRQRVVGVRSGWRSCWACSGSRTTAISSPPSCRPEPVGSSNSPVPWAINPACCCSTSPRPGSPNARSRRCRPCCGAFATTWGARSWSSNTTCH